MGFLQYLINLNDEKDFLNEMETYRSLKADIEDGIEAIKNGYDICNKGKKTEEKCFYYEYIDGEGKRLYRTIDDWKLAWTKTIYDNQLDIINFINRIKSEWLEYVDETGDTDISWNQMLELFNHDDLVREINPESTYLHEEYPEVFFHNFSDKPILY